MLSINQGSKDLFCVSNAFGVPTQNTDDEDCDSLGLLQGFIVT